MNGDRCCYCCLLDETVVTKEREKRVEESTKEKCSISQTSLNLSVQKSMLGGKVSFASSLLSN